jgi:NADPH:quinone reductase-like Zn-dependent oxidoreductase
MLAPMRQIWITKTGSPDVLVVKEASDPEAKKGEVRVRVRASGINFADLMARVGLYPDAPKVPCVVGYEVSGVIDQVGEGVTGFHDGERVLAMCHFGGYSDVVVLPSRHVFKMPQKMSFEEGAAFPVVFGTAYNMMLFNGHLRPRSSVLIHSAAGGVGLAAIQIAKTRDCVILGTASASKHAFLKEQGCHHPLDSNGDYAAQARGIVGDKGIDLILDPVGGKSWTDGYDLLAPCGRLVAFGLSRAVGGNTRNLFRAATQFLA